VIPGRAAVRRDPHRAGVRPNPGRTSARVVLARASVCPGPRRTGVRVISAGASVRMIPGRASGRTGPGRTSARQVSAGASRRPAPGRIGARAVPVPTGVRPVTGRTARPVPAEIVRPRIPGVTPRASPTHADAGIDPRPGNPVSPAGAAGSRHTARPSPVAVRVAERCQSGPPPGRRLRPSRPEWSRRGHRCRPETNG
jgi:hypothetical protein